MLGSVAVGVLVVVTWSVLVGATAPRWPRHWLDADHGPLRLNQRESAAAYRASGIPRWSSRLPDAGPWFGGASKRELACPSNGGLDEFVVETRRAEWVHWLSIAGLAPASFVVPLWTLLAIGPFFVVGNAVFIIICRHNRLRIYGIMSRMHEREQVA